jgi:hypothetical protein
MDTTKIIELFIDDDYEEAGIEAISLVSKPAHDETWMAFNSECSCGTHKMESQLEDAYSPYTVVDGNFCNNHPNLATLGEPAGTLESDGWEIVRIERMTPQVIHKMNQQRFSRPNDESVLDKETFRVRYKYIGPRDSKTRDFCEQMLSFNRVYRIEDIDALTDSVANPEFGFYEIFTWRGSYNCRHQWVRLIYKKEGTIINSGSSTRGLEDTQGLGAVLQPDTRTEATINSTTPENQWKPGQPRTGNFSEQTSDGETVPESQKMVFSVIDEEKKIIVGAAMVPNRMIHRYDDLGNLYYVFFSKESIKKMADKFLKEKRTDETSIEHNGLKLGSQKVFITESWVSEDPVYDKSRKFGFDLPVGTWYVSMKVNDDKVWKLIKDKALTGYSVEGLFAEKSVFSKEDEQINQITKLLKSIKDYDK